MQKITTFLMFEDQAEEAAKFYVSVFKNAKILGTTRAGEGGPLPAGTIMGVSFELDGQAFSAFNGGSHFKFSDAISLMVNCETQDEIDYLWEALSEGGQQVECGWVTDRFGVSWQIVPRALGEMLQSADPRKAQNVMQAVLQMKKLDLAALRRAYEQA